MKRKTNSNGPLHPKSVKFLRALIDGGIYPEFFDSFTYELPRTNLQLALVLGALSRLHPQTQSVISNYLRPILLGWVLKEEKAKYEDLKILEQYNALRRYVGEADMLDQLQPPLPSTRASVFELRKPYDGIQFLKEFTRYAMKEDDQVLVEDYISKHQMGFGLTHAKEIIKRLTEEQYIWLHDVMPLRGSGSLGNNLFVLVADRTFRDMNDKEGKPGFGWYQITVHTDEFTPREHVHACFHRCIRVHIPKGSFIALANVEWIRPPEPHSD